MTQANVELHLKEWKEITVFERTDGTKLTRVEAEFQYSGDLDGASTAAFLLLYRADGTGVYSGWERFSGTFRGAFGETVFANQGIFDPKAVSVEVVSEPRTSTGSLASCTLKYAVTMEGHGPYPLLLEIL